MIYYVLKEDTGKTRGYCMKNETIEQKVQETFEQVNYNDKSDAIDVIGIAQKLGFVVGNAQLDNNEDGFILVQEGKRGILGIQTDKLIGVNASKELPWKRFVIAHEIGHYILHYNKEADKGMYAHRDHIKGKDSTENEADYFAANLLMPKEKFRKRYEELAQKNLQTDDITILLAEKFGVTHDMVTRRYKELQLIG